MQTLVIAGERPEGSGLLNTSSTPIAPLETPPRPLAQLEQGANPANRAGATEAKRLGVSGQIEIMPDRVGPPPTVDLPLVEKHELKPSDEPLRADPAFKVVSPRAPSAKSVLITNGQQSDVQSLTGQVERYRKNWRLRYADAGQVDRHGGVVVLEGGAELSKLVEGQRVQLTGTMIPPPDRASQARFRVQSVQVLD